eukprot:3615638-Prymnesium_polylepis.1
MANLAGNEQQLEEGPACTTSSSSRERLGGVLWLSCSKGCAFTPLQCVLGIPLTPLPMDYCMASSVQNAKESKYGWSFNFGTLYAVDVEHDTFACFRNGLGTDQNTVCCYCAPLVGCGSRCRGEDAW